MVSGKILVYELEAYVLIDPRSTHSFISQSFASHLHACFEPLGYELGVTTPLGELIIVNSVYWNCEIQIEAVKLQADLILLPFQNFDVILGMDWLS